MSEAARPPLAGLRVVDLTRHIPGPFCTMMLADLGADVVKVEEPGVGDPTRAVPPAAGEDSSAHASLNRGKRSVALDIRLPEGAEVVRRLAGRADVLVEGFRPGVLERRGLGFEALSAENPKLVYCSISGWGQQGPLAARAGHDIDYVARAGLLDLNRDGDGAVVVPGAQLADMSGGLVATATILAALLERQVTGRGRRLDVSLLGATLGLLTLPIARGLAGGVQRSELSGDFACYTVYPCRDGAEVAVGALEPKFWQALCAALGLPELAARQWDRGQRRRDALQQMADAFASRTREEWLRELQAVDACVEPVLSTAEAWADAAAAPFRLEQPGPDGQSLRTVGSPFAAAGLATEAARAAPRLGEHTATVLAELGYSAEEIERMARVPASQAESPA